MMMLEDEPVTPPVEELLLTNEDFPNHFVNFAHPEDYIISSNPIEMEKIFHQHKMRHPRLILRVSWKLQENEFMPMTFVLDTGAPKIYLNSTIFQNFQDRSIILADEDMGVVYLKLLGHKYLVEETPEGHSPANIIGLKTLCHLGLQLSASPAFGYDFTRTFSFFDEDSGQLH